MKILIYGINYQPELTGIGKYSGEMANWLANSGHDVHVITAPPYYPEWNVRDGYRRLWWKRDTLNGVTVIRSPLFVPSKPNAINRILHLLSFSFTSIFPLFLQLKWKPDLIILVVPTLFCAPATLLFAKLAKSKSVIHIQDYEIDALFGLGILRGSYIRKLALRTERLLLSSFDWLSTISNGMIDRAIQKGVPKSKLVFFPNWSELDRFEAAKPDINLLIGLGVPEGKRVILYSGNIGERQGLEYLLDVAEQLAPFDNLIILIIGDGSGKDKLVSATQARKINNIIFAPVQSYALFPRILVSADVHLIIQRKGAADAVLPSKLTNILAVGGNAVITAEPNTTLGILVTSNPGIATLVDPESSHELFKGILSSLNLPLPNHIAKRYASENLDINQVIPDFLNKVSPSNFTPD